MSKRERDQDWTNDGWLSHLRAHRRVATRRAAMGLVAAMTIAGSAAAASATLSLHASPARVAFGDTVTFNGRAAAHAHVELLSQPCGFTGRVRVSTKTAGRDGFFAFKLQPTLRTTFWVRVGTDRSNGVTVRVEPAVAVSELRAGAFSINVSVGAGHFFTGQPVSLQARTKASEAWRTVGTGSLKAASPIDALIAVSKATVRAKVKAGSEVRAELQAAAAGTCFLASASPPIKV